MERILLLQPCENPSLLTILHTQFQVQLASTIDEALALVLETDFRVMVYDVTTCGPVSFTGLETLMENTEVMGELPLVFLSSSQSLADKLTAFELGVDDYLESETCLEEVCARVSKSIFHRIASAQLKDRLDLANATAYTAMSDNSDLGSNIQFLLGVNRCDNLDQLGQLLFSSLSRYGISCSLQMRGLYEIKNMEANGMAKDLESQLLMQMKDAGRYIDFGRRSLINYGQSSLLVRDMPEDDERRYGAIKDNTFALIQGVDARIKALDEHTKLLEEKEALKKLSVDVKNVMTEIDNAYQVVMRTIVNTVEVMAEQIQEKIPVLALSEEQEMFFEETTAQCVSAANSVFADGLKVDESFHKLSKSMDHAINNLDDVEELHSQMSTVNTPEGLLSSESSEVVGDDSIELF